MNDLYKMWANAITKGQVFQRPSRRYAGGMISFRPNKDGRVVGYSGVEHVWKKYGPYLQVPSTSVGSKKP